MNDYVHIHAPQATRKFLRATICLDCGKRTRMLVFFTPWYGDHSTCLRCGREWIDGEWIALPFARGSRHRNIDDAKRKWRSMPPVTKNHYFGWGD